MLSQFYFKDLNPSKELRSEANQTLDRILDEAPFGAITIVLIEKDGAQYRCSVDIYTKNGPLIASTVQATPLMAIKHVEDVLLTKLGKWKKKKVETWGTLGLPIFVKKSAYA